MADTREKILDTAEQMFGEQGYANTSIRQIIEKAGVNLASVHYHFGSKEELLDEVLRRRFEPLNRERLALLERCEAENAPGAPPVEKLLEAMLAPVLRLRSRNEGFLRLVGRLYFEGPLMPRVGRHMEDVRVRFVAAMRRALPELPPEELAWRAHFVFGAVAHSLRGTPETLIDGVRLDRTDTEEAIRRLVAFSAAGLQAPVAPPAGAAAGVSRREG
jgi:AcrR family transcriptional regulator